MIIIISKEQAQVQSLEENERIQLGSTDERTGTRETKRRVSERVDGRVFVHYAFVFSFPPILDVLIIVARASQAECSAGGESSVLPFPFHLLPPQSDSWI